MTLMASAFGVMLATFVKTERSASSIGVLTSLDTGAARGLLVAFIYNSAMDAIYLQDYASCLGNYRLQQIIDFRRRIQFCGA